MTHRPAQNFLPYARQSIDESDIEAVTAVLRSDFLTTGPAVWEFEATLADRLSVQHAVACSSGTAALHLACMALGLGPGDAAIVPAVTFLATANAVRMTGAEPVFADVDAETGLMRPQDMGAAWVRAAHAGLRVKAVLPVHLGGQCENLAMMAEMARPRGAVLIEDAAHALGSRYRDRDGGAQPVGACAHAAMTIFSFHAVKTVAAGEGGAVTTNDPALAQRLVQLRNHGVTRDSTEFEQAGLAFDAEGNANPWYYEMQALGWNYRLSDLHAALGASQLRRLAQMVEARAALVQCYDRLLKPFRHFVRPIRRTAYASPAWHLYPVLIDFDRLGRDRSAVMAALRKAGVGSQVHYIPVPFQPYYRNRADCAISMAAPPPGNPLFTGAEAYYRRTLSLPLYVGMTAADVERVVASLAREVVPARDFAQDYV